MTKAWEREKSRMHDLYMVRGMKLSQMQLVMREQHNFLASERAYKQKFKEWKWFKKTPRNSGISLESMGVPVEPPLATTRQYRVQHTHHIPRHSSSSPVDSLGNHPGQMSTTNAYGGLGVNSDHAGYSDSQHTVLGLGNMHGSVQPIVRSSENYVSISLPPVSDLIPIEEGLKESVRSAALLLDSGKLDDAETFLEHAIKTLQWLRNCR
ncbi:uncharacterized protein LAJ45_03222 [Morchella importuna]|uniref:Clr5 domain-containing protein n=1 Tax=Morchella conica CCBAS932 TaxID=1392247 RepID=A0A3N4KTK1_9PEZI|nr:uncharacterized protein LAJ45_03222 [Morchella importuna]KAH8152382.1 hypothetical protein LAJ45_03222 [Morchella importuna]RPB13837.1 hypothetical protein P167DRAFT_534811 [Morchella conica CCBAS932]